MRQYELRKIPDLDELKNLGGYSTVVSNLLFHRNILNGDDAEKFLNPDYEKGLHDPFLMKDMEKAVERVLFAIQKNERIGIYSDYDSDGIPAGVIFHDFFKKIGFENFENYIPHRHLEGFGLNEDAVKILHKNKVKLLITLDCGIADVVEVALANKLKMDVIVTDHHEPAKNTPKAYAILNPKQEGCQYPNKNLCGSGVAFKFIEGILQKLREGLWGEELGLKLPVVGWEKWLLDLVGLATLADMVPLVGENRVLAQYGLSVLRKSPRLGLKKLISVSRLDQRFVSEEDIGFTLSPRINAASRMGSPMDAFNLLKTVDEDEANVLAGHLVKLNDERKIVVATMVREIKNLLKKRNIEKNPSILFLGNPLWKPAILGLVAGKFAEEYKCPVFLWGREDEQVLKGSCRSDGTTDLLSLMESLSGLFIQFGGHKMSGGFSFGIESLEELEKNIHLKISDHRSVESDEIFLIDRQISTDEIGWDLYRQIEKLAPFGMGNEKPVFLIDKANCSQIKAFGKDGNHTELKLSKSDGKEISAIGFFKKPEDYKNLKASGGQINLVGSLEKSVFRGFPELRLRIVDIL